MTKTEQELVIKMQRLLLQMCTRLSEGSVTAIQACRRVFTVWVFPVGSGQSAMSRSARSAKQHTQVLASTRETERIMCSACQHRRLIRGQVVSGNLHGSYLSTSSSVPLLNCLLSVWGIIEPCGTSVGFSPLSCQKLEEVQIKSLWNTREIKKLICQRRQMCCWECAALLWLSFCTLIGGCCFFFEGGF